ncbi:MAG: hypothetical protein GXP49_09940 [Deltaproteobacteria bacterium]|nr:hypothetical protein [Deltaproteobacteria bacterium]
MTLRLKGLGVELVRAVLVDTVQAAVAAEIRRAVMAGTDFVVVTSRTDQSCWSAAQGGVAKATGKDLLLNPGAREIVLERFMAAEYGSKEGAGSDGLRALARIPVGGRPLKTDAMDTPGFVLEQGSTKILCIPSEPELAVKAFDSELLMMVRKRKGRGPLFEAALALPEQGIEEPITLAEDVMANFPGIYIRMLPKTGGRERFQISADLPDGNQSRKLVELAVRDLKAKISMG